MRTFNKRELVRNLQTPLKEFKISTESWHEQKAFNIQSDDKESSLIKRIDVKFDFMNEFAEMFSGVKAYEVGKGIPPQTSEIRDSKPYTSKSQLSNNWLPFFDGKDIGRYQLYWHENNWINYGEWLAAPRLPANFKNEKILIRKIVGKTLIAHYIEYTSYCNTLLFVLKLKPEKARISYKALLGIINSKFISWYFRKKFQITGEDTFPQIMIRDILQFAIPNETNSITATIEELVTKIVKSKVSPFNNPEQYIESQIDQLVYQLYGLTDEEIKIVEGA